MHLEVLRGGRELPGLPPRPEPSRLSGPDAAALAVLAVEAALSYRRVRRS